LLGAVAGACLAVLPNLIVDINDFEETAHGHREWDVKRLATSLSIAGRSNGF
jgi:uncharacterized protein (DUF2252 family)